MATYTVTLDSDPLVDNTAELQAAINSMPDGVGVANTLQLPYAASGFRVDGTVRIDSRKNIVVQGESADRPFIGWTDLTGPEAYPQPCDSEPDPSLCTATEWMWEDGIVNGTRSWRWSGGQSMRSHWWIEGPDSADGYSENITLQHIRVRGPNVARMAEAPDYAAPQWGAGYETWETLEAEHAFQVGSQAFKPSVKQIRLIDCHAENTHGDGFQIDVDHATRADILIEDCSSKFAGRHSMSVTGGWGITARRFVGTGAYSAVIDVEPNVANSGVLDFRMEDWSGASYRIPILIQNGGAALRDISIDGFVITDSGYHTSAWYPVLYADTVVEKPVGELVIRGLKASDGTSWNSHGEALIQVSKWPRVEISNCSLAFLAPLTAGYGVRLTDVDSFYLRDLDFGNNLAGTALLVRDGVEIPIGETRASFTHSRASARASGSRAVTLSASSKAEILI